MDTQEKTRLLSVKLRSYLAVLLVLLLSAATVISLAEPDKKTDKHFTLESATAEVSQDPNRAALTIKEIAKLAKPSIVGIRVEGTVSMGNDPFGGFGGFNYGYGYGYNYRQAPQIRQSGAGSGIILSADGYILTNSHVVEGADTIKVLLSDEKEYDAILAGQDKTNDIAILKINADGLSTAIFGDSSQLEVGELAVAIGNPLGEVNGSVTAGIISAPERTLNIDGKDMKLLQTDAAINPGNSGGALINSFGEVIGIVTAKTASVSVEGIGYAIPINNVKSLIEDIVNNGSVTQAGGSMMLGVSIRDVDKALAEQYNIPEGVYVVDVEPFGAAEKAGVHRGDTIVSLAGKDVENADALTRIKAEIEPGVPQPLVVLRGGEKLELSIVLGAEAQPKL